MYDRFRDSGRRVVVLAQEEARLLRHNYIGTEHLLLGLIRQGEGVAAQTLISLGISLEKARSQVEFIIGLGGRSPDVYVPMTPRTKKALELSLRQALQLGHSYIDTEHILLGLIQQAGSDVETVAGQVFVELQVELDSIRNRTIEIITGTYPELPPKAELASPLPVSITLEISPDQATQALAWYKGLKHPDKHPAAPLLKALRSVNVPGS